MILEWLIVLNVAKINNQIAMNIQIVKVTANIQVFSRVYQVYGYMTGLRVTEFFSVTLS